MRSLLGSSDVMGADLTLLTRAGFLDRWGRCVYHPQHWKTPRDVELTSDQL